ncbi:MAG TPA: glycosyltransferase [Solirubrobacteraceae bacterium]|nr:glycosyltransferase [Solirubrobacteraceae bacterium]
MVLVAARDESARIAATLRALETALPHAELWLADDASRDETARIARRMGARVVQMERHAGKGAAMSAAAAAALRALGEKDAVFLLCDADLGASAGELAELARAVAAGEADLAIAAFARPRGGGLGLVVGFARRSLARRTGKRLRAPLSGQRALRASSLARLLPFAHGYGMELGMTLDAWRLGMAIAEVELDLEHRATGRTPAGFAHRARQLVDLARALAARR